MMNFVVYCIIAFLCAFGFICLLYTVWNGWLARASEPLYILVPCDETTQDIELKIKAAQAALSRCSQKGQKRIVVLDNGMSELTKEIAHLAAEDSGDVLILRANELQNLN
ncbi:MAG: hypothetical protein IJI67_10295 [Clostridia bacterium]|nr:hypothetical protein [Clostridia bacterium]